MITTSIVHFIAGFLLAIALVGGDHHPGQKWPDYIVGFVVAFLVVWWLS